MKKILAVICSIALCMAPVSPALAVENSNYEDATVKDINLEQGLTEPGKLVQELEVSYKNPLYSRGSVDDGFGFEEKRLLSFGDTEEELEAIGAVREALINRENTFSVKYYSNDLLTDDDLAGIFNEAIAHTGNPEEGDYLRWHYEQMGIGASTYYTVYENYDYIHELTFSMTYYTNAAQEAIVADKVAEVLDELNVASIESDYLKAKAIYKYICDNVTYDYENLEDDTYVIKFSAYGALIDKTAVCQGYSNLLYRMLLEAGIDNRIISGIGNGGPHAWNIIQMQGHYYNTDATWDTGCDNYEWLLKGSNDFDDHSRDAEYLTTSFQNAHPTSAANYTLPKPVISNIGKTGESINIIWEEVEGADKYEVWRKVGDDGQYTKYRTTTTTEITDEGITSGKVYHYKVSAISDNNNNATSPFSDSVSTQNMILTGVTVKGYTGTYDGQAHSISVTVPQGAAVVYSTSKAGPYTATKPTLTEEGSLTVYYKVTKEGYAAITGQETITILPAKDPAEEIFGDESSVRLYGQNRFETSIEVAETLKKTLGVEKFKSIIVADGMNFADALAGTYLAKVKEAPILTVGADDTSQGDVIKYIKKSLAAKGKIYILGGSGAVEKEFESSLKKLGYTVKRLEGPTRFETNLAILKEAGVSKEDILVCSGFGFADSLSASAVGKPILLVDSTLSEKQKEYLKTLKSEKYYLIGGTGVVGEGIAREIRNGGFGTVERVAGSNRFSTSVAVAKKFFSSGAVKRVVLAYAMNFPDGLSGGPLAMSIGAPLLLVTSEDTADAREYFEDFGAEKTITLGGPALISDMANLTISGVIDGVFRTPYGKRYHFDAECGGKNAYEITIEEAERLGFEPCSKCAW